MVQKRSEPYGEKIRASQIEGHDAHRESLFDESRTPSQHEDDRKTPERRGHFAPRPWRGHPEQAIDDTLVDSTPVVISRVTVP